MFEFEEEEYYDPSDDGYSHINAYSKGKTELGRMLSNFAYSPFVYEPYGKFNSVEGFYYWYLTGQKHDDLRELTGAKAKIQGQKYNSDRTECNLSEETIEVIQGAIIAKIAQNPKISEALLNSTLPIVHYYVSFGRVISLDSSWYEETLMEIRSALKMGQSQ